jgi:steroid delta-isomerase-like uncharacterized protein
MIRMSALVPAVLLFMLPVAATAGPAENKITASRVILEKMGQGRFEIQPEIYGPGFIAHGFGRDYTLAEDEASGKHLRSAFPDLKVSVDRIIAEDDMVSLHWSAVGTNTVAVPGFPGEGKRVAIDGMSFFRFTEGKIVEEWSTYDNLAIMKQLGQIPAK